MNPPQEQVAKNHIFCYDGSLDNKKGTIYVDFTSKFPIRSVDGMTAIFILYDWTTNAILATPVKDGKSDTTIAVFEKQIQYLTKRGFKPTLNIINNVATKTIQTYLEANDIRIQLVEPNNHRVNAAERAIQTFKNHMLAGLSTCDEKFPSLLWDRIVPQAQDSLNMLRTSRAHPKLSSYHVLEGAHNFNRVPWDLRGPEPLYLTPQKREHRGAHAPSTPGTSGQPPTTTGATIFICRLPGAPKPPLKQHFTHNTAKSHTKLPWIRHAALPRT
jgi:hypothetical protein